MVNGKDTVKNPYGEQRFKSIGTEMEVLYNNESNSRLETRVRNISDPQPYFNLNTEVLHENKSWSKVKLDFIEKGVKLPVNRTSITFNVRKSNNVAYETTTGKCIGFFPFYIYNFVDNSFMDGEWDSKITLGEEYESSYVTHYGMGYREKQVKDYSGNYEEEYFLDVNNTADSLHKEFIKALKFESEEEVTYTSRSYNYMVGNYSESKVTREKLIVASRGHYPINIGVILPAEIFFNNITDQEKVYIQTALGADQGEAVNYLKTIDIGDKPSGGTNYFPVILMLCIVSAGIISAYLAYRKKR